MFNFLTSPVPTDDLAPLHARKTSHIDHHFRAAHFHGADT